MTQPTAQPTLQPLVFLPPIGAAPLAAKQSKGEPATGGGTTQPVVFTSSAPTRTTSKTKTTAQPSVNLFDKAAAEYLAGKSPKARTSTPRVFLPLPAPVTKNAHETKLEIVTEPPDAGRGHPDDDRQAALGESPAASITLRRVSITLPMMRRAWSEARQRMTWATSSGSTTRI